ncbi:hypothetical protein XA68_15957 [Ophiocordyceps unilateralis]|uniref:Uncharacterized protein n=1 Tax=Ophiocordyceps unilateralis TaxID=268505 RepID=A0A2A9P7B4_OPHUN|nr:hypothetical protein XA68_15957 [Ophiocordyceps unilateralis]
MSCHGDICARHRRLSCGFPSLTKGHVIIHASRYRPHPQKCLAHAILDMLPPPFLQHARLQLPPSNQRTPASLLFISMNKHGMINISPHMSSINRQQLRRQMVCLSQIDGET